jgi:hypothetical protein
MATMEEANRARRIAALEAASRVHSGDEDIYPSDVIATAERFLEWLEQR